MPFLGCQRRFVITLLWKWWSLDLIFQATTPTLAMGAGPFRLVLGCQRRFAIVLIWKWWSLGLLFRAMLFQCAYAQGDGPQAILRLPKAFPYSSPVSFCPDNPCHRKPGPWWHLCHCRWRSGTAVCPPCQARESSFRPYSNALGRPAYHPGLLLEERSEKGFYVLYLAHCIFNQVLRRSYNFSDHSNSISGQTSQPLSYLYQPASLVS